MAITNNTTWKEENDTIGIFQFFQIWPTEEASLEWVENHRWRDGIFCPRCGGDSCYRVASGKPMSHRCRGCKEYFSVRIGTPLEHTKLPIQKWLLYMHEMLSENKGATGKKNHIEVETGYRTAWFLGQRVRRMAQAAEMPLFEGVVQIDEAYLGGKWRFMHEDRKKELGNWRANKIPVIGVRENDTGRVHVERMYEDTHKARLDFVLTYVKPGSEVWTDGHPAYRALTKYGYVHKWVDHNKKEYVDEDGVTVNGVEGHWSNLKRKYHGTHHWLSPKHAQNYIDESTFRLNIGDGNGPITIGKLLDQAEGRTLPWKKLVKGNYGARKDPK